MHFPGLHLEGYILKGLNSWKTLADRLYLKHRVTNSCTTAMDICGMCLELGDIFVFAAGSADHQLCFEYHVPKRPFRFAQSVQQKLSGGNSQLVRGLGDRRQWRLK